MKNKLYLAAVHALNTQHTNELQESIRNNEATAVAALERAIAAKEAEHLSVLTTKDAAQLEVLRGMKKTHAAAQNEAGRKSEMEYDDQQKRHALDMEAKRSMHESAMLKLQAGHESELEEASEEKMKAVDDVKRRHTRELAAKTAGYDLEVHKTKSEYSAAIEAAVNQVGEAHQSALRDLELKHAHALDSRRAKEAAKEVQLELDYAAALETTAREMLANHGAEVEEMTRNAAQEKEFSLKAKEAHQELVIEGIKAEHAATLYDAVLSSRKGESAALDAAVKAQEEQYKTVMSTKVAEYDAALKAKELELAAARKEASAAKAQVEELEDAERKNEEREVANIVNTKVKHCAAVQQIKANYAAEMKQAASSTRDVVVAVENSFTPPSLGYIACNPEQLNRPRPSLSGRRKAVLVGINYLGSRADLSACINDVHDMQAFLVSSGFSNDAQNMMVLTDDNNDPTCSPTRANIERAMQWLVAGATEGDCLFFLFSGHGGQQVDPHSTEKDCMNETLVPVDYESAGQVQPCCSTLHNAHIAHTHTSPACVCSHRSTTTGSGQT
jgi:hypothetical protein